MKTLVIKGNIEEFYLAGIKDKDVDTLVLEEGVERIIFLNSDHLKILKLYLPKSMKSVEAWCGEVHTIEELTLYNTDMKIYLRDYINVKTITVIDGDYKFIKKLFKECKANLKTIVIINTNLSNFERKRINKIFKSNNVVVQFFDSIDQVDLKQDENTNDIVQNLINKIKSMIVSLDDDSQKIINDKINYLIEEYQTKLKLTNPEFKLNDSSFNLTMEDNSPKNLKNNLIFALETIIQNLNIKNKVLVFSKKFKNYEMILNNNKIDNTVEDENAKKIRTIINLSNFFCESKIKEQLLKLFKETQIMILDNLKDENVIKLTLEPQDAERFFENKLDILFEEINILNDRLSSYLNLLKALQGYQNDLNLSIELRQLEKLFSNLIGKSNDELGNLYKNLRDKYINITNDMISKLKNGEEVISAKEIEINFRKELQPILKEIQQKLTNMLKNQKIYHQLSSDNQKYENGAIIDLVKEIKKLSDNSLLTPTMRDTIIDKLSNTLIHWQCILLNDNISEIVKKFDNKTGLTSENLIIEVEILKELYEIKLNLEEYLNKLQEHNEYITDVNLFNSSQDGDESKVEENKSLIRKKQIKDIKSKYDYRYLGYFGYDSIFNNDKY